MQPVRVQRRFLKLDRPSGLEHFEIVGMKLRSLVRRKKLPIRLTDDLIATQSAQLLKGRIAVEITAVGVL